MSDSHAKKPTDRRDFLLKLGTGAGVAALTAQAAASLRSLVPNVSYDSPTQGNTFHAISAARAISIAPERNNMIIREDGSGAEYLHLRRSREQRMVMRVVEWAAEGVSPP